MCLTSVIQYNLSTWKNLYNKKSNIKVNKKTNQITLFLDEIVYISSEEEKTNQANHPFSHNIKLLTNPHYYIHRVPYII